MLSSPAKRRKTSETTAAAIDALQMNQKAHENNGRFHQRRPSFQSPTKASLARSHPEVLARALSRSPTRSARNDSGSNNGQQQEQEQVDSRTFGLRDRKALRPSIAPGASPMDGPTLSPRSAFAVPPRRVSRKIGPLDLAFGTPEAKPKNETADPLPDDTPEDQLAELGNDVNEDNMDQGPSFLDGLEEPELPPTPTQLGLEKPPGRPKGLLSSSPSARYERRTRQRIDDTPKPSVLKLENFDATGNPTNKALNAYRALLSDAELKRQQTKKELSAELKRLKDDVAELEAWTEKLNNPNMKTEFRKDLNKLISLLSSENASHKQSSPPTNASISSILSALLPFSSKAPPKPVHEPPSPTNPFAMKEHAQAKQYLTVFAPLSLTTHSNKVSASESAPLTESHSLTLSTGPPFPQNLYNITLNYETNPETQSLLSISIPKNDGSSNVPEGLRRWIDTRLSNPLLKLDVSGLCWGINRYWEASISRAQIWSRIEARHSKLLALRKHREPNRKEDTSDLRHVLPHLDRTSMTFCLKDTSKPLRVLISCALTLDEWTSEPRLFPEVSIASPSASGKKIEQETKKLFNTLLRDEQGADSDSVGDIEPGAIVRAVDAVVGVLFGLDDTHDKGSKGKLPVR
ncbi:uncharacterized protein ACHE_31060S [Aspergillus chevalieri]|uniref:Uncharacterized protein n=1 Tax=Aspergillus chevalieri TaxID=182096 RepID=A0A7R7VLT7_ASPCH|nr:uncharacterized protein ACHE_31060S [Aspergillus chevalieri]BCR87073.1 hypothetical protein ACHE_31060S [Aspergillus chevalieri]